MHHKMAEVKSKNGKVEIFLLIADLSSFFPRGGVAGVVFGESRKRGLGWGKMRPGRASISRAGSVRRRWAA